MDRILAIEAAWEADATPLVIDTVEAGWKDEQAAMDVQMEAASNGEISIQFAKAEYLPPVQDRWNNRLNQAINDIADLVPGQDAEQLLTSGGGEAVQEDAPTAVSQSATVMVTTSGGDDESEHSGAVVVSASVSGDGGFGDALSHLNTIPAIDASTVNAIARDLQLDEAGRQALDTLHATHESNRLAMETERAEERKRLQKEVRAEIEGGQAQDQATMMKMAMITMQPISREGLDELDDAFFDGAESLANDPGPARVWRLARQRELSLETGGMMSASLDMIGLPDNRWSVDLLELIQSLELEDAESTQLRAVIADWHEPATHGMLDLKDRREGLEEAMQSMITGVEEGGAMSIDMEAAMNAEQLRGALQKARAAQTALTQRFADAIEAAVADPMPVRRAWMTRAFPKLAIEDEFASRFDRAAGVPDLTDEQRLAIITLRAEHDAAWWDETRKAVAIMTENREQPADQQQAFFQSQRLRQKADRHTFTRREAALKRLEALRQALSEAQLAAVNGLEDPPQRQQIALPF